MRLTSSSTLLIPLASPLLFCATLSTFATPLPCSLHPPPPFNPSDPPSLFPPLLPCCSPCSTSSPFSLPLPPVSILHLNPPALLPSSSYSSTIILQLLVPLVSCILSGNPVFSPSLVSSPALPTLDLESAFHPSPHFIFSFTLPPSPYSPPFLFPSSFLPAPLAGSTCHSAPSPSPSPPSPSRTPKLYCTFNCISLRHSYLTWPGNRFCGSSS